MRCRGANPLLIDDLIRPRRRCPVLLRQSSAAFVNVTISLPIIFKPDRVDTGYTVLHTLQKPHLVRVWRDECRCVRNTLRRGDADET